MEPIPPDIDIDRLPGPKRGKWPENFFRDWIVWSPSNARFALAYCISEIGLNNDIGCVLWGEKGEHGTRILGNPKHVHACCWDIQWCTWLDDEVFVFKAYDKAGQPLVIVHVTKGFTLLTGDWPDQVKGLPADVRWQAISGLRASISARR
jgi:hypothetical protein